MTSRGSAAPGPGDDAGRVTPAVNAVNIEKHQQQLKTIDGEFKGLRAQFTEFKKHVLSVSQMKSIQQQMTQFENVWGSTRESLQDFTALVQKVDQHSTQLPQLQQQMAQAQQVIEQDGVQLRQLQQHLAQAKQTQKQLEQQQTQLEQRLESLGAVAQTAGTLMRDLAQVQRDVATLKGMQADQARLQQEQGDLKRRSDDLKRKSEEAAKLLQTLQKNSQDTAKTVKELKDVEKKIADAKKEVDKCRQEMGIMKQDHTQMKRKNADAEKKVQSMLKDVTGIKNEAQGAKGIQKEQQASMRRLEDKTRGLDDVGRLKATVQSNGNEFWALKKQLYDSGVLAPPKIPEPEKVPVGTLELGEDVFTARLLMRLGFMKEAADAHKEALEAQEAKEGEDEEGPEVPLLEFRAASDASSNISAHPLLYTNFGLVEGFEENVTGIAVPEVEGEGGFKTVSLGWTGICFTTLFVQALIVMIMIMYGVDSGGDCIDSPLPPGKWYMLHVSKAFATLAAGTLMGKELMDIVNYWMVSMLLESKSSLEVAVSAVFRIALIVFIAMANVILNMTMTNPADVWINMTALGFIGELSEAVLDVARKGVFGHNIGKAVGSVNFALNFMSDYPWWFIYARGVTLLVAVCFIGFFAFLLYVLPDNVCLADGTSQAAGLLERIINAMNDAMREVSEHLF